MSDYRVIQGVIGFALDFNLMGYDLTGYTCTLLLKNPSGTPKTLSLNVQSDNRTARRVTLNTDFDVTGLWEGQVKITNGTKTLYSVSFNISVDPALG